jgi:hypothetical protein
MAWLGLTLLNCENLILVELACNHGCHFNLYDDEALLESLAKDDEDYEVIDGMGDPQIGQPPIPHQYSPPEIKPQDVPTSKRPRK